MTHDKTITEAHEKIAELTKIMEELRLGQQKIKNFNRQQWKRLFGCHIHGVGYDLSSTVWFAETVLRETGWHFEMGSWGWSCIWKKNHDFVLLPRDLLLKTKLPAAAALAHCLCQWKIAQLEKLISHAAFEKMRDEQLAEAQREKDIETAFAFGGMGAGISLLLCVLLGWEFAYLAALPLCLVIGLLVSVE